MPEPLAAMGPVLALSTQTPWAPPYIPRSRSEVAETSSEPRLFIDPHKLRRRSFSSSAGDIVETGMAESSDTYTRLQDFLILHMRMSHVYQPVMLKVLIE